MMSAKDYRLLADVLARYRKNAYDMEIIVIDQVAQALAVELGNQNPRFDAERFLKAIRS
jgi:hypothetical protein